MRGNAGRLISRNKISRMITSFIMREIGVKRGMNPDSDPPETPTDQLPAVIAPAATALATPLDAGLIPALIADAGDQAAWRYIDFFTANIRNPNTRRAYARACSTFFAWCDERGLALGTIRPYRRVSYT